MSRPPNVVLLITDGHGYHTGDLDWGTTEFQGLRSRMERLRLAEKGFAKFDNVMSPAVSTIMSIESMLGGIHAAKAHKMHWREWPAWDRLDHPLFGDFMAARGYDVNGFSYLLNAENWMPGIRLYEPSIYRDFPSQKRDTHSHLAVLAAVRHFFAHAHRPDRPQLLMIHTIFLFDIWDELCAEFERHGIGDANTIFAFTADHYFPKNFGRQWLFGERDKALVFHHIDLTEYNTRVFLYLKAPGIPPRQIDEPVAGYDLVPTLLDLLGAGADWPGETDGRSLVPLLEGRSLPPRFLRCDNVYPYQIGEKQGRITAIRRGRWKYVVRPDPVSSYIVYRMSESWRCVLEREEFYDVVADPEEQANLVGSDDPEVIAELAAGRAEYRRSNAAIHEVHARGLAAHAAATGLAGRFPAATANGRILCLQTCPPEVCGTLVRVLCRLFPGAAVTVVGKALDAALLPEGVRRIDYPEGRAYDAPTLGRLLGDGGFACVLRLSNVPVGDHVAAYDAAAHPLGDYDAVAEPMRAMAGGAAFTFALDASLQPLAAAPGLDAGGWPALLRRRLVEAPLRWAYGRMAPTLKRWAGQMEQKAGRMPESLSERIVRSDRPPP